MGCIRNNRYVGEIALTEAKETHDLLALIGTTIERLRQGIELFETSSQAEGAACLSAVIREIDAYMDRALDDPLLQLARIDVSSLATDLKHIKSDLDAVITQVSASSS